MSKNQRTDKAGSKQICQQKERIKLEIIGPNYSEENRRFLRKTKLQTMSTPIPSALPKLTGLANDVPVTHSNPPIPASNDTHTAVEHPTRGTDMSSYPQYTSMSSKISQALSRLLCITLQFLKNCLPLIGLCLYMGIGGKCWCRNKREFSSFFQII